MMTTTGSAGVHISASEPGAQYAKTTAKMATLGCIFHMIRPARVLTVGTRMAWPVSVTTSKYSVLLWNGQDPILKERLFGLAGPEGNHGEDVKEYYFYLDSTPTHSYMKMLYKYPQAAYPYDELVHTNRWRSKNAPEYELIDTGVFAENR